MYILVGHKSTLYADRLGYTLRIVEHIALAQQLLCAHCIQYRPGVHTAGYRKCDTRRYVCLDNAGDDIDRRSLRRDHQMYACGSCQLRYPADGILHLVLGYHHEIRQLVYDDHYLRHLLIRQIGALIHTLAVLQELLYMLIIARYIADSLALEHLVALHHLLNSPVESSRRLLGISDHRNQQMRYTVIYGQFYDLGIHHDELYLIRCVAIEDAEHHRIDADRLARAGSARYQHMRHLVYISYDHGARYIHTHGEEQSSL